jgi:hypothetical protein
MNERPLVSVVLLSYNRPRLLRDALDSVCSQSYENVEVIVVDNKSGASDEIAEIVCGREGVRLIRTSANLGFTGGMNLGASEAHGRYIYLTEDDIVLAPDCLSRLVDYAQTRADTRGFLLAPVLYNKRERTIRCAGGELSLGGIFSNKIYGAGEPDAGQFPEPLDVAFIPGSTVFCELEFFRRMGGFRADFFMYSEDRELCLRVVKAGGRITVVPEAKAYHFEPEDATVHAELEFHILKNFYALYLLHAPSRVLPEFICRYVFLQLVRSALGMKRSTVSLLRASWWVARNARSLLKNRLHASHAAHSDI